MLALALAAAGAAACGGSTGAGDGGTGGGGTAGSGSGTAGGGGRAGGGGGTTGGGGTAGGHPDTGYGANKPVPATVNCTDFCTRLADCGADLCNEDTMSTSYTALVPILVSECESSACNASVLAMITPANWQCYFQSSCRQVFEHNACQVSPSSYTCN
jgi:hypothetical protein